ncbi:hypothetical protein J6590_071449 [Homalodisca vitripennis]|nr:hypothetical protein J6590_071449 [Homalodisca vitripennis]
MYTVSIPLVILCMILAFFVMLISFWVEEQLRGSPDCPQWLYLAPSVAYAALIYLMNMVYRRFANNLTEWENHRTQSQFDRHRVTKLVLFEFVNNFMSLFYIAFIYQDMDMLRSQLATLLIISQAINNFQEALLPLILQYYSSKMAQLKKRNSSKKWQMPSSSVDVQELSGDDPRILQALRESRLDFYESYTHRPAGSNMSRTVSTRAPASQICAARGTSNRLTSHNCAAACHRNNLHEVQGHRNKKLHSDRAHAKESSLQPLFTVCPYSREAVQASEMPCLQREKPEEEANILYLLRLQRLK